MDYLRVPLKQGAIRRHNGCSSHVCRFDVSNEGDLKDYVFSDKETAQIAYDSNCKVVCISIDYMGGDGAPDYRNVVGADIETKSNGSMYKLVGYEQSDFGSRNRSANDSVVIVTITIQKISS